MLWISRFDVSWWHIIMLLISLYTSHTCSWIKMINFPYTYKFPLEFTHFMTFTTDRSGFVFSFTESPIVFVEANWKKKKLRYRFQSLFCISRLFIRVLINKFGRLLLPTDESWESHSYIGPYITNSLYSPLDTSWTCLYAVEVDSTFFW